MSYCFRCMLISMNTRWRAHCLVTPATKSDTFVTEWHICTCTKNSCKNSIVTHVTYINQPLAVHLDRNLLILKWFGMVFGNCYLVLKFGWNCCNSNFHTIFFHWNNNPNPFKLCTFVVLLYDNIHKKNNPKNIKYFYVFCHLKFGPKYKVTSCLTAICT